MSYEYRAQMMNGTIKDAKDNYENAKGNAEKEKYEIEIQRLQSLQNAYKTAGDYEAKVKAWDALKNNLEKEVETLTGEVSGFPYVDAPIESAISHFEHVLEMMKKYESGELDD